MKDIYQVSHSQTTQEKPVVAFYWDYQNVKLSLETAKFLLKIVKSKGILVRKNIYYNYHCKDQSVIKKELASLNLDYCYVPCFLKNSPFSIQFIYSNKFIKTAINAVFSC